MPTPEYVPPTGSPRRLRAPAAALVAAVAGAGLLLAACGSGNSAGSTRTESAATASVPTTSAPHDPTTSSTPRPRPKPKPKPKHTTTTSPGATVGNVGGPPPPLPGQVTFVGDSVGVDATPYIQQDIPGAHCDAMVDRSWGQGESILQSLAARGALGSIVVVELGLNGPITTGDFQSMMAILARVPRVVFVNIRLPVGAYGPGTDWWGNQNNEVLASEIPHYRNAVLANWYALSAGHQSWFASDGIHLDAAGGAAMAALIKQYV